MAETTSWDYWCPPEGEHHFRQGELHVGVVRDNPDGTFTPVLTVAVLPPIGPLSGDDGEWWSQPEDLATVVCVALSAGDWKQLEDWMSDKGMHVRFPKPATR